MRYLIASAVVAILILAPLGSYIYLRSGLKYRLESQAQLSPKEISPELRIKLDSLVSRHRAALVHISTDNNPIDLSLLKKIDDRITDRDFFDIISYSTDRTAFGEKSKIKIVDLPVMEHLTNDHFILIDSSGAVRKTYKGGEDFSKELIRHLSVVIPLPKSREIRLKRELE